MPVTRTQYSTERHDPLASTPTSRKHMHRSNTSALPTNRTNTNRTNRATHGRSRPQQHDTPMVVPSAHPEGQLCTWPHTHASTGASASAATQHLQVPPPSVRSVYNTEPRASGAPHSEPAGGMSSTRGTAHPNTVPRVDRQNTGSRQRRSEPNAQGPRTAPSMAATGTRLPPGIRVYRVYVIKRVCTRQEWLGRPWREDQTVGTER
ncbi:hypothetical protein SCP_1303790 [Sparassis crispa]|uniref:Uncharacterized protein n=1 Tax=Sparassis crispa TaxID=139825 RepID=A0A401H2E0_9APHY|nr:hypothetical protein SCP_1303790 [Sparassis crispa]GBE88562.1 hypothetical protein SCP_1303790 [Sparassis crispa]